MLILHHFCTSCFLVGAGGGCPSASPRLPGNRHATENGVGTVTDELPVNNDMVAAGQVFGAEFTVSTSHGRSQRLHRLPRDTLGYIDN
jgi:hypothetical protein